MNFDREYHTPDHARTNKRRLGRAAPWIGCALLAVTVTSALPVSSAYAAGPSTAAPRAAAATVVRTTSTNGSPTVAPKGSHCYYAFPIVICT
jgi:hypothetical protein